MSDLNYDTFSHDELMPLIPDNFVPGSFLQSVFFPGLIVFDTKDVKFDRILTDRRRAPLVAPLAPGQIQQPRGYQVESIIPASMKPKDEITGDEVLTRMPGERIGGEMSASEREARIREMYLMKHQERITRTREWMASSILRTGSMILTGEKYPATTVNYARDASLTKALLTTARWGESGVSPYDDLDSWMDEVGELSGSAVDIVCMDRLAWNLYAADPKVEKALDRTLGQTAAITLGFTPGVPGAPIFKGRDGGVEFYVYNDIHDNEDFSATEKLVPEHTVMLGSVGGLMGHKLCGVVQHAENRFEPGEYFPHEWIDSNTGAQWVETITAPILAPGRINASACVTVR